MTMVKASCYSLILLLVTACATTPTEKAYDLATKYEVVQVLAEAVVTDEEIPADVRRSIQTAEAAAFTAVNAYVEAVRKDDADVQDYLRAGLEAVMDLTALLAEKGLLGKAK